MNKTLAALVLGVSALGGGCFMPDGNKRETGLIDQTITSPIPRAAEAKGWDYLTYDKKSYGESPAPCENLSEFGKATLLFPIKGVKNNNIISGRMCCMGYELGGNFVAEYCMLLENKAEMLNGGQ